MSKRYFLNEDATFCYEEEFFMTYMEEEGRTEMIVLEAIPTTVEDYVWCNKLEIACEASECNKECDLHLPKDKNAVKSVCQHRGKFYDHGEKITLYTNNN